MFVGCRYMSVSTIPFYRLFVCIIVVIATFSLTFLFAQNSFQLRRKRKNKMNNLFGKRKEEREAALKEKEIL